MNQILMLKIETTNGKKIAKRFVLTFLSEKNKDQISELLMQIIAKKANGRK